MIHVNHSIDRHLSYRDGLFTQVRRVGVALLDASAKASVAAVAAFALWHFAPCVAFPLLGIAAGVFVGRLVINLTGPYNWLSGSGRTGSIYGYFRQCSAVRLTAFLVSIVVAASLAAISGAVLAGLVGIEGGLFVETEQYQQLQTMTKVTG